MATIKSRINGYGCPQCRKHVVDFQPHDDKAISRQKYSNSYTKKIRGEKSIFLEFLSMIFILFKGLISIIISAVKLGDVKFKREKISLTYLYIRMKVVNFFGRLHGHINIYRKIIPAYC